MSWERDDVIRFLNVYPLPKDFVWGGQIVQPRYMVEGYGKWLFESGPYYVALRGLPQLVAEVLPEFVEREKRLPLPEELAALLSIEEAKLGPLFRLNREITQTESRDNPNGTQALTEAKPNGTPDLSQP